MGTPKPISGGVLGRAVQEIEALGVCEDQMKKVGHYRGALLGSAAGDALGASLEGLPPNSFAPVEGMIGGGFHGLKPGY